jgi:hypothetical protein
MMMNKMSGTLSATQSIAVDANASLANGHEREINNTMQWSGRPVFLELHVAIRESG